MQLLNQALKLFVRVALIGNIAFAQEEQPTMFVVHTDYVNFDKMAQYEDLAKQLKDKCTEHAIDMDWLTVTSEDGRYMYVSAIENMAELDKNPMEPLYEKMGKEAAGELFGKMDECYDKHGNEIVHFVPELSHNPEGYSSEGMNFREYHFLYYPPRHSQAMYEAMQGVKKMFEDKGIKNAYSVYHSGFGSEESYYMVSISGSDSVEIAQNGKSNDEAFGEEGQAVFYQVIQLTSRYDQVQARVRPDLSYSPKASE